MNTDAITLVYFSPTNTTRTVLESVAKGMGKSIARDIDLTRPENRENLSDLTFDGPVLLGAPVYAGRLPKDAALCFKALKGNNTPAVLVVAYGNREYEDALVELKDIAQDRNFTPVSAAAFIGEHSFSSASLPIAPGRPDEQDLALAREFGQKSVALIEAAPNNAVVAVSGNTPYKEGMGTGAPAFIQVTEQCDACGTCLASCPKAAIDEENQYATIPENCILCCACIKACPNQARVMMDGPIMDKARWLHDNCSQRKKPQMFYSD